MDQISQLIGMIRMIIKMICQHFQTFLGFDLMTTLSN